MLEDWIFKTFTFQVSHYCWGEPNNNYRLKIVVINVGVKQTPFPSKEYSVLIPLFPVQQKLKQFIIFSLCSHCMTMDWLPLRLAIWWIIVVQTKRCRQTESVASTISQNCNSGSWNAPAQPYKSLPKDYEMTWIAERNACTGRWWWSLWIPDLNSTEIIVIRAIYIQTWIIIWAEQNELKELFSVCTALINRWNEYDWIHPDM